MSNNGLVFYDKDSGVLVIGEDDKGRIRQVQLSSSSGGSLKFYEDGAFELVGQPSATLGDNVVSQSSHGLKIYSKGDLNIYSEGKITLKGQQIIFDSGSSTQDFVLKNENGGIRIEAPNGNIGIKGKNVAVSAKRDLLLRSKGNVHIVADGGQVFIIEPKSKLVPSSVLGIVNKVTSALGGWV
jgi:hypothetical protein